jgi:hypothetical protein
MVTVGIIGGYPPADFGMRLFAAFQQSPSFATFSTDTVPAPGRRAVRTAQFAAASRGELRALFRGEPDTAAVTQPGIPKPAGPGGFSLAKSDKIGQLRRCCGHHGSMGVDRFLSGV